MFTGDGGRLLNSVIPLKVENATKTILPPPSTPDTPRPRLQWERPSVDPCRGS